MAKRISPQNKIAVVKPDHIRAFVVSLNKTVPTYQERTIWKNLSTTFSVRSALSTSAR